MQKPKRWVGICTVCGGNEKIWCALYTRKKQSKKACCFFFCERFISSSFKKVYTSFFCFFLRSPGHGTTLQNHFKHKQKKLTAIASKKQEHFYMNLELLLPCKMDSKMSIDLFSIWRSSRCFHAVHWGVWYIHSI